MISEVVTGRLREDPNLFAEKILSFHATEYQKRILRDESKRVAIRMARQSGKSLSMGAKALWYAVTHKQSLVLVVSPSLRQSIIFRDKMNRHINSLPRKLRRLIFSKILRTTIYLHNGSQIVILPCSPDKIRGYTADMVIVDEAAMIPDDRYLFNNVLAPTLAVKDGYLYALSTPKNRNSHFYEICKGKQSKYWSQHHYTWKDAVEAGIYTGDFVEGRRAECLPHQFMMEWEAEFIEDADSWLPYDLITNCIDSELDYYSFEGRPKGRFYLGVDFGKHEDHSVVAVVERHGEMDRLIHLKRFKLETAYASVIGYVKALCQRYRTVQSVYVDMTGVGDYICEDMERGDIPNVKGVLLTLPRKEEVLTHLKQRMIAQKLRIPYDSELIAELNVESFEFSKEGRIRFTHPPGTHDDRLWAVALAVYAAREEDEGGILIKL